MRRGLKLILLLAPTLLFGCNRGGHFSSPPRQGRFAGIGVFDAGELWGRMVVPGQGAAPQAAATADDEHIIVVVDTQTGEVRECGDHSGYCVAMNPWTQAIAPGQRTPVPLSAHAADLAREAKANDAKPGAKPAP